MRDIKFRVWHKPTKKMGAVLMAHFNDSGIYAAEIDTGEAVSISAFGVDLAVMQFTGLRDMNGVEIYEGDIIYCSDWWWGQCSISLVQEGNVMEWRLGTAVGGDAHNLWYGEEIKVVGNIHESPELLEQTA